MEQDRAIAFGTGATQQSPSRSVSALAGECHAIAGHTPGPWLYRPEELDDWGTVRAAPDSEGRMPFICQARNPAVSHENYAHYREEGTDPFEANARLIAAAPEMRDLLNRALDLASKASRLDWNEDRNIMGAVHLAGDIRALLAEAGV